MKVLPKLSTVASLLLLAACNTAAIPEPQETITQVISVPLEAEDTRASIAAYYGAEVMVWTDEMAVIGLENAELFTTGGRKNKLNQQIIEVVESNDEVFAAGGQMATMNGSTAWANGSTAWANGSTAWANGSTAWANGSTAWANGEFMLIPANTAAWQQINLEQAQSVASNLGYGVVVAVIDTGVDLEHPAIIEGLAPASSWKDYVDNDATPQEKGVLGEGGYGHGTSVAGIIRQIAPAAQIMPLRVLNSDGSGNVSDIALALVWAVDHGADIINMSLGSQKRSKAVDAAINYATSRDVIVISSVGNSGTEKVVYPAKDAENKGDKLLRLSVTSVDSSDHKSDFASYHSSVEIAAPGEDIFGPAPEMRAASWSGTSMAAPVATGAITLALGENYSVPKKDLTDKLIGKSYDFYNNSMNETYKDLMGKGRIDVAAFLEDVLP